VEVAVIERGLVDARPAMDVVERAAVDAEQDVVASSLEIGSGGFARPTSASTSGCVKSWPHSPLTRQVPSPITDTSGPVLPNRRCRICLPFTRVPAFVAQREGATTPSAATLNLAVARQLIGAGASIGR
jgi:hypothetical protein